jgi:hypothetical protein
MGNYGDDRGSGDRWRNRAERGGWSEGRRESGGWSPGERGARSGGEDDRNFLDRAGDELRSWFGDDEAQHRRELDERRWQREQGMTGHRDNDLGDRGRDRGGAGTLGGGGFGGGWNNQAGESWNSDRPGRPGWFTDSVGGERGHRRGGSGGGYERDERYGAAGHDRDYGASPGAGGPRMGGGRETGGGHDHDPLYAEWRRRQIEELDRDYAEYRREHQSRFEQEFGGWRSKRQGQRQLLMRVEEHMEVVGSDGSHVGTVDKVAGDRIVLTNADAAAGGLHHSVPCSWVETVADRVTLNRSADDARSEWRNEERSRALFERPDAGNEGPHVLNRSFAGTYDRDLGETASRPDDADDKTR